MPAGDRDDRRADDRSETKTDAEDDPPGGEGACALGAFPELMGENRDLTDQHRTTAHALEEAADDEEERVFRQAADQGGEAEHGDADHEYKLSAIAICQRAGCHQHRRDRDGVGIHDPLQLLEAGVQHRLERRQDRRYAGYLQAEHEGREAALRQGRSCFVVMIRPSRP